MINKDAHFGCAIDFRVSMRSLERYTLWITEDELNVTFKRFFSEEDYRKIFLCGKVVASKYIKEILDADLSDFVSKLLITCVRRSSCLRYDEFVTQRLVGKKRLTKFELLDDKVHVALHEVKDMVFYGYALDDRIDEIKELVEDEKALYDAVKDYKSLIG